VSKEKPVKKSKTIKLRPVTSFVSYYGIFTPNISYVYLSPPEGPKRIRKIISVPKDIPEKVAQEWLELGYVEIVSPSAQMDQDENRPPSDQYKIDKARERFLKALAKNLSGKRAEDVKQAARLIAGKLPLNEKLQKIVELFPLTASFSSREWAKIFGVTHAAIQDTDWWKQNRSGEKDRRIAEREDRLRERGKTITQRELQGGSPD